MARNKHPEETVAKILDVSMRLFTEQGLPGAVGAELRPGQRENKNKIQAQDEIMMSLK